MSSELTPSSAGQLVDVFVNEVEFRRNLDYDWDQETPSYTVDSQTVAHADADGEGAMAELTASIEWNTDEGRLQVPFDIKISLIGLFSWQIQGLPTEEIEGWVAFNSEHLLWPYLRAEISRLTANGGLPPLTIYTIGVPRPHLGRERADRPEAAHG